MRTMKLALALLAIATACGGSSAAEPAVPAIVGAYSLATVNGSALPATVNVNGTIETFSSGTLSVADTSYQFSVCIRSPGTISSCGSGYDNLTGSGAWFPSGSSLIFLDNVDRTPETATFAGGRLTVPYGVGTTLSLAFQKQ